MTPWTTACQASLSITNSQSPPKPMSMCQWCHPIISSYVVPFSSHLQSFPASGSFQMSQLFASGSQSIGVSASISVLPMNIQDWSPLGWTSWISLTLKSSPTPQFKSINSSVLSFLYTPTFTSISHIQLSHLISQLNKIVLREPKNSHKRPFRAGLNHLYRGHPLNGTSAAQRREPQSWESDL